MNTNLAKKLRIHAQRTKKLGNHTAAILLFFTFEFY